MYPSINLIRPPPIRAFTILVLLLLAFVEVYGQFNLNSISDSISGARETLSWCTISDAEEKKCKAWSEAIRLSNLGVRGSTSQQSLTPVVRPLFEFDLKCRHAADKDQCMNLVDNHHADLVTLDPGEIFIAGRHHSLVPIMAERYGPSKTETGYYSVAVIKRPSPSAPIDTVIGSLRDLNGSKACFTGVSHMGGWVLPMATMVDARVFPIKDCNNIVKSAAAFFGFSCAPNSLIDKHNPTGDNPPSMCALCSTKGKFGAGTCSGSDSFAGFDGAFRCLATVGDVAWLKHTTVDQMTRHPVLMAETYARGYPSRIRSDFELLCPQGGRRPLEDYQNCNFGFVPAHAVVISSAVDPDRRQRIQRFLKQSAAQFGANPSPYGVGTFRTGARTTPRPSTFYNQSIFTNVIPSTIPYGNSSQFYLFGDEYDRYKGVNLLFSDETTDLYEIPGAQQTFAGFLKSYGVPPRVQLPPLPTVYDDGSLPYIQQITINSYLDYFEKLRGCPVPVARFCVISDKEVTKCNRMRTAFKAQMLKPELSCIKGHSSYGCMDMIARGFADLTMLDAADVYQAGHKFALRPILAERYDLDEPKYYVVAIARQSDKDTDLLYLKGKRSCHTGYMEAAGWVIPMSFLLSNQRMRSYGCNSARAASEFFSKACAPGILSRELYPRSFRDLAGELTSYNNLCDLCHGSSYQFCSRDSGEPFHGDSGALRCLVEGGGQIAFAKHTTILENTAGRNPAFWSRNVIPDDFELLCRDGTRSTYNDFVRCNLGAVPANAMVARNGLPEVYYNAYMNLFLYGQQYYGSKYSEDFTFKMFVSRDDALFSTTGITGPHDLIFQDATTSLQAVPMWKQENYHFYLGHEFVKAMTIVDCAAGASQLFINQSTFFITLTATILINFIYATRSEA